MTQSRSVTLEESVPGQIRRVTEMCISPQHPQVRFEVKSTISWHLAGVDKHLGLAQAFDWPIKAEPGPS